MSPPVEIGPGGRLCLPAGTRIHFEGTFTILSGGEDRNYVSPDATGDPDPGFGAFVAGDEDDDARRQRLQARQAITDDWYWFIRNEAYEKGCIYVTAAWVLRHIYASELDANGKEWTDDDVWRLYNTNTQLPIPHTPATTKAAREAFRQFSAAEQKRLLADWAPLVQRNKPAVTRYKRQLQDAKKWLEGTSNGARLFDVEQVDRNQCSDYPSKHQEPWLHTKGIVYRIRRRINVSMEPRRQ